MPTPRKRLFDHIDLRVHRMDLCGPFYRQFLPLLGFTDYVDLDGWLQFQAAGTEATEFFGVTEDRGHRPNRSRVAFWADSRSQVDELAAAVRSLGALNVEGPEEIDPTYYAVYFDDPSGNALEICHRTTRFESDAGPSTLVK